MNFSIGDTVGAYRILEELGRGGMGRVFKVEHTITRRLEAMKVLEGGRPDAPEQAARSLREIQLQASLDHPNIAAVHNAFWVGEDLVLIMELIEGSSLRSLLDVGRLPLGTALEYARQALAALSYSHAHGVIHRDVSPANMMISPTGVLKLTDFGLAKGQADLGVSRSGTPLGSLYYMSPEQVRGTEADARSDIYSFGAVLYELLTGEKPFGGESAFYIMSNQIATPPVPPIEVEPTVPHPLSSAILRSLEKDPARRFSSAEEFVKALTCVQNPGNAAKWASPLRPRAVWAAASVVIAALALGGIVRIERRKGLIERPAATVASQPDSIVSGRDKSAEAQPVAITPALPPSGSKHVRPPNLQPPIVSEKSPDESELATATREPASTRAPESQNVGVQSSEEAPAPLPSPAEGDAIATTRRGANRFTRTLVNIWHLGRHKGSSSEETPPPPSENP